MPIFERLPALSSQIHPVRLGSRPTTVELHGELGARIGVPSLWVKHDDRIATPYGGGKIRKLELFLGEAQHEGCSSVVTSGAVGSNHAVATAIFAQQLGLHCRLLLMHGPRSRATQRNLLADYRHGAALELVGGPAGVDAATARLVAGSAPPYVIPTGGTSPLGNLAYIDAALELEQQVLRGVLPEPDVIVVALGTMGTAIGLTLGMELSRLRTRVVAVRVSNVPTSTEARFAEELEATRQWLIDRGIELPQPSSDRSRLEPRYLGRGYGYPTRAGEAARRIAEEHGVGLELTYTAKAFAAVVGSAPELAAKTVLFWHTHSALAPPVGEITPADLPSELRGYFPPGSR